MKAVFGQVIAIAILSLVLVGVYFYKTTHASACEIMPQPIAAVHVDTPQVQPAQSAPQPTPQVQPLPQVQVQPLPQVQGQVYGAPQQHHSFLYKLVHPRQWRIFQHRGKQHAYCVPMETVTVETTCTPVWVVQETVTVRP